MSDERQRPVPATATGPHSDQTEAADRLRVGDHDVMDELERTLAFARRRDYRGWDYCDGMSSRLLQALPVDSKWLNIAVQETAKRCPVNVRPLLLVEQRRNCMGAALFAMADQTTARLVDDGARRGAPSAVPNPPSASDYERETRALADWLVESETAGYGGYCVGYPHPIQHLDGRGEPGEPDVVNTSFAVKALLRAAAVDERYAAVAESAADFVTEDLHYRPVSDGRGAVVDYHTKHPEDYYTINAGAICARMFVDLYDHFDDSAFRERATELLDHVADLQTDRGGWKYRDPPEASHLSMDTHHNAFIVETFLRYAAVCGRERYREVLDDAVAFVRDTLFEPSGAPNWDESDAYPKDVHACANGILVFTYAGDLAAAERAVRWTLDNLYAGDGRFLYRKERLFTRRVTLMRWCQAWMAFALSEYARAVRSGLEPADAHLRFSDGK